MCGIVAVRSWGDPVAKGALVRATDSLRHRGPDGRRTWVSPSGRAGLGHARLAINDPEGAQPIASEDGRLLIAANGEFYDFRRERRRLRSAGHRFRTRSDTEVALHLYEDAGSECLHHLRGQFAFAVWNERSGVLFAARDRFGLKPLFYSEHRGALYLASEAKALFAAGVPAAWDLHAAYQALHACPDERRSLFAGVAQLPPGHFLTASDAGIRIERWWDLPPSPRPPPRTRPRAGPRPAGDRSWTPRPFARGHDASEQELRRQEAGDAAMLAEKADEVRRLFLESVRLRLDADVPLGCLLSGGLDSSAVLGAAASQASEPPTAFTIGFERRSYDESDAARRTARVVGARHVVATLRDRELADHFADAVWHAETIQYNAHGVARFLLGRAVRDAGFRAVLAGEGADETFFGYEFLRAAAGASAGTGQGTAAEPRLAARAVRALRLLPRLLRSPSRRRPALAAVSPWVARLAVLLDAPPALFDRLTRGLGHLRSISAPAFLHHFRGYDPYRAFYRRCNAAAGLRKREPARQLLYLWLHSLFVNYHLAADRLDMAHSVEVRLPFLDHHLFEHVNALPLPLLAATRPEKLLLRTAARPFVPEAVHARAKRPFWAPPSASIGANPLHDLVQDLIRGQATHSLPFFDHAAAVRFLDALPALPEADRPAADSLLLMLASAAVLQERYRP